MKAESILRIKKILEQKVEIARYNYKSNRHNFEQKYETEWLDSVMTEQDKKILYGDKKIYSEAIDLLDDFNNHQWK